MNSAPEKLTRELVCKDEELRAESARVAHITDRLGKPIDKGIRRMVTALHLNGFPTTQSCEGHLKRACCFPWVRISVDTPEKWRTQEGWESASDEEREKFKRENLQLQKKLVELLDDFYLDRPREFNEQLMFSYIGRYGAFQIQSAGGAIMEILAEDERVEKLARYQREMEAFALFLECKFFIS